MRKKEEGRARWPYPPLDPRLCSAVRRSFGGNIPEITSVQYGSLRSNRFDFLEDHASLPKPGPKPESKLKITRLRASTSRLVLRRVRKRRESGNGLNARPKVTASLRPPGTPVFPLCSRLMRFRLDECERWTQAPGLESAA